WRAPRGRCLRKSWSRGGRRRGFGLGAEAGRDTTARDEFWKLLGTQPARDEGLDPGGEGGLDGAQLARHATDGEGTLLVAGERQDRLDVLDVGDDVVLAFRIRPHETGDAGEE